MHIDALQLFLSLRALALARMRVVVSSTPHTYIRGNGFWRPRDLMMLLERWDHDGERSWELTDEWIYDNVGYRESSNTETEISHDSLSPSSTASLPSSAIYTSIYVTKLHIMSTLFLTLTG